MNSSDQKLLQANALLLKLYPVAWLAVNYHKTHKNIPLDFEHFKYLKQIYKDDADQIVMIKSTQCGISEYLIVRTAILSMKKRNILYVLPTEQIRNRFVATRVNKSIEYTPQYRFNRRASKSSGLKEIGSGMINLVGSNAQSVFTEFVAHDVIIDELDQCNLANVYMSVERQSSIEDKTMMKVSNPTILDFGIDEEYKKSDKKVWMIKCSSCNEYIKPDFFEHIVEQVSKNEYVIRDRAWDYDCGRDILPICHKCKKPFDRYGHGQWVKQNQKSAISGYHVSKIFSTKVKMTELLDRFNEGLTNDKKLQRFYNGDLGEAFTASGAKISAEMLNDCVRDYSLLEECKEPCLIGIDVGGLINVIIAKFAPNRKDLQAIYINTVQDEKDILDLFKRYNIILGIIDSKPEMRMSRRLVATLKNLWMVDYLTESTRDVIQPDKKMIKTDRTTSLDGVKEAVLLQSFLLPKNAKSIEDFYDQMTSSTRIWQSRDDTIEGGRYVWIESKPDHYFHCSCYLKIAQKLLLMMRSK